MKKKLVFVSLFFITFNLYALAETFSYTLTKEGMSSFYFDPSEVIAFKSSQDADTVATANFTVNWKLYIDTGFTLTLEARSDNTDLNRDMYCMLRSDGTIGLNYLMVADGKTAGSSDNQDLLSQAERTIIVAESTGSDSLPIIGSQAVTLSIPYPTKEEGVTVNGVYQGFLVMTLTYN